MCIRDRLRLDGHAGIFPVEHKTASGNQEPFRCDGSASGSGSGTVSYTHLIAVGDKNDLYFPGLQPELLRIAYESGKPVILVSMTGSAMAVSYTHLPDARGTFIGMTMDTTRADMTQAVLEGVAFALRDSFEVARSLGISIERTKICGGGAKSPLWKKIIANVLNVKVDVPETEEGPGYGAAMLAAVACGEYASVEEAAKTLVKVVDTIEPDPVLAAKYEERYAQFKQIYPAVRELFGRLK